MAKNKGGEVIRKGKRFSIVWASADDPIYTRGYVVGGNYTKRSSKSTEQKSSSPLPQEIQDFVKNDLPKEVRQQMSEEFPTEKTDQSGSSTGEKDKA